MHNVQNAMFAAAMAFSLGIKLDAIRQGLRTFDTTFFQAPGRMNVFNEHPFKVLFDYGHNAHAVAAMADLAQRLDVTGRRIVVLAGPGDRRDEDLRRHRAGGRGPLRSLHLPPRRQPARSRARRGAAHPGARRCAPRACRSSAISIIPGRAGGDRRGAAHGPAGRSAADLRRCAGALLEADHQVQAGRLRRTRRVASPRPPPVTRGARQCAPSGARGRGAGRQALASFNLEGLIRDERGMRMAPEGED